MLSVEGDLLMLRQYFSKLCSNASEVLALAMPIIGALARRRELWFDSRLAPILQEIPLNTVLALVVVVVGLLAILVTPILPLLVVGVVAFFLSFDRRATTKFVMMGGLNTFLGALTIVDLPHSPLTSMRLGGSQFTTTFLATLNPYMVFGIAAIGLLSLGLEIALTPVQRDVLSALINLHRQEKQVVKGEEIAELMDRHPGTIRNLMQSLKLLNLVKGVTGPKGGYTAMATAYEVLSLDNIDEGEEVAVPVIRNGIVVEGVSATEIAFDKLMQPTHQCDGLIRITGNIKDFDIGDEVEVGPTPVHQIYICGKVLGWDCTMNRLILNITGILSIPRLPVKKIAQRAVRISPKTSLREASRMLVNNGVQEALVEGESPGLINLSDITRAVAEGKTDLEVREIMTHSFLTINPEEPVFEAIKILGKTGVSLLVVSDSGVLWGFITPRNLIRSLLPY
jgi:predicted transcriptional regulator